MNLIKQPESMPSQKSAVKQCFSAFFAATEPSANDCVVHGTLCNDSSAFIATTTQNYGREFRPRIFRSVSAEPLAATRGTLRFRGKPN